MKANRVSATTALLALAAPAADDSADDSPASEHTCWCGCGSVVPAKSFYKPGHDSRHVGQVARQVAESDEFDSITGQLPTKALQLKAWNMAYKLHTEAARRARRKTR